MKALWRKMLEAEANSEAFDFLRSRKRKAWSRDVEAVLNVVEAVKFLWKRKHFEERSWKQNQPRKRLTLYRAGSGNKKYSTSTSLSDTLYNSCKILTCGRRCSSASPTNVPTARETRNERSLWNELEWRIIGTIIIPTKLKRLMQKTETKAMHQTEKQMHEIWGNKRLVFSCLQWHSRNGAKWGTNSPVCRPSSAFTHFAVV